MDVINELGASNYDAITAAKWILGISSRDQMLAEIPHTAVHDGKTYTLAGVRFLEGKVDVQYPTTKVRYFETQENAQRYAETGNCCGLWEDSETERCPIRAERHDVASTWEYMDTWLNWANDPNSDIRRKSCKR